MRSIYRAPRVAPARATVSDMRMNVPSGESPQNRAP
jgi:hypothetical protein